jgi:uncharacterized protein YnzC (UPF0291/DUF896 family)
MGVQMQKIYLNGKLIAEAAREDTQELIDNYIAKAEAEIKPMLDKIKVLENMVDDLYPKRRKDNEEEYLAFLSKVNPEFIETLNDLGNSVFGDRFTGLYIIAPNTVGALMEYWTNENYKDKVSIAALRERLKKQIPSRRHIEIIED